MGEDLEKAEDKIDTKYLQNRGKRQSLKDNINVCAMIIFMTILAVIVTSIKIVLIDMNSVKYAALFGNNVTTTTTTATLSTEEYVTVR